MTYLVAFDGRDPAKAAARRAASFADSDERLVVVSVLPTAPGMAEAYGLTDDGEYDPERAALRLQSEASELLDSTSFRAEYVDAYAGKGRIAATISRVAREEDAEIVFLGGGDAGRVVQPVSGVGDTIEEDPAFDVYFARPASVRSSR